jgi:hypothetical protein
MLNTLRHTIDESKERTIPRNICWNRRDLQHYWLKTELSTVMMMMMNNVHYIVFKIESTVYTTVILLKLANDDNCYYLTGSS